MRTIPILCASMVVLLGVVDAQDDPPGGGAAGRPEGTSFQGQVQILVLAEFIGFSTARWHSLAQKHAMDDTDTALHAAAGEQVASGHAQRFETTGLITRSGQRAKASSVVEDIYATDYNPSIGRLDDAPAVPVQLTGADIDTPTGFETRNVGTTLEVDPVISADGQTVDLNVSAEIVDHPGDTVISEIPIPGRDSFLPTVVQPLFYTMKTSTAVSAKNGDPVLVGVLTPHDGDGEPDRSRKVALFVRSFVLPVVAE